MFGGFFKYTLLTTIFSKWVTNVFKKKKKNVVASFWAFHSGQNAPKGFKTAVEGACLAHWVEQIA